jgi:nitroreductase
MRPMELEKCIKGRRSIRAYKDEPVPKEKIEAVLEAGVWAATGMNKQPWRFVIIEDKSTIRFVSDETKKAVKEIMPAVSERFNTKEDIICYNAPTLIFICTEKNPDFDRINLRDSVLAAQNMFLKAHELGLGTCYMGWIDVAISRNPKILEKTGVPKDFTVQVPLIIGYPKNQQGLGKRNKPNILNWTK